MNYVLHTFGPSETIDAVIKLKYRHDLTNDELIEYRKLFNELNGLIVPKLGMTCKIPVPELTV